MLLALIGIAIVLGFSAISTLYAMKKIGALGEIIAAKDIRQFPYSLVFMGIAETPIIFALLYSLLLLSSLSSIQESYHIYFLISSPILALSCLFGGIGIARVSESGLVAIYKDKSLFAKILVFVAFPGTVIIYALLISLLILFSYSNLSFNDIVIVTLLMIPASATAYFLGSLGVKGIKGLIENTRSFSYSLVLIAIPESVAIYLLLLALLVLFS